ARGARTRRHRLGAPVASLAATRSSPYAAGSTGVRPARQRRPRAPRRAAPRPTTRSPPRPAPLADQPAAQVDVGIVAVYEEHPQQPEHQRHRDARARELTDAMHVEAELEPQEQRQDRQSTEDRPGHDVADEDTDRRLELPAGLRQDDARVHHVGDGGPQGDAGEPQGTRERHAQAQVDETGDEEPMVGTPGLPSPIRMGRATPRTGKKTRYDTM